MKRIFVKLFYKLALRVYATKIVNDCEMMTPKHLQKMGFVKVGDNDYEEPNMKNRDLITVRFDRFGYTVFHSRAMTFIACEKSVEWFEMYYMLMHQDNGRHNLSLY